MTYNNQIKTLKEEIKVLYQKIEELEELERRRPITLQHIIEDCMVGHNSMIQLELLENILDRVEVEFLSKKIESYGEYSQGWNDCLEEIKERLRE